MGSFTFQLESMMGGIGPLKLNAFGATPESSLKRLTLYTLKRTSGHFNGMRTCSHYVANIKPAETHNSMESRLLSMEGMGKRHNDRVLIFQRAVGFIQNTTNLTGQVLSLHIVEHKSGMLLVWWTGAMFCPSKLTVSSLQDPYQVCRKSQEMVF